MRCLVYAVVLVACSSSKVENKPAPEDPAVVRMRAIDAVVADLGSDVNAHYTRATQAIANANAATTREEVVAARAALDALLTENAALEKRASTASADLIAVHFDRAKDCGDGPFTKDCKDREQARIEALKDVREQAGHVEQFTEDLAERRKQLADAVGVVTAATNELDRNEAKAKLEQLRRERDAAMQKHR